MRKVCLINNYNYDEYLDACLNSVVNQSLGFDVVYVVDDGSTDGSKAIIERYSHENSVITPIYKSNGGQLSCFNVAVEFIREDDQVFLLDADDLYPSDYVEEFQKIYHRHKYEMYFCDTQVFGVDEAPPETSVKEGESPIIVKGSSRIAQMLHCWVGNPTSAIVVTGRLFKNIFPYPHESDWITRADDILVYGSSFAGYEKAYIPFLCVGYRVHGNNSFFGKDFDEGYMAKRKKDIRTLFLWCYKKYSLSRFPSLMSLLKEYKNSIEYYRDVKKIDRERILKWYLIFLLKELLRPLKNSRLFNSK